MPDRFITARPSNQRLETVEQELQDFSYTVSHDLAASFRRMSAFSQLLVGEFAEDLSYRQRTYAEQVQVASTRCQLMMEQLLVFSRAQGRLLEPVRHDATLAVRLAMLQLLRDRQPVNAEVTIEPLGYVYADPDLLGLLLRHLFSNASKFRCPDQAHKIHVSAVWDRDFWRLHIRDNGLGVEPEYREQAFQMFRRLHGDDAYPGVGAGLAICRRIAHRHGGEITFLDCDDGAWVELRLPNRQDQSGKHSEATPAWAASAANDAPGQNPPDRAA